MNENFYYTGTGDGGPIAPPVNDDYVSLWNNKDIADNPMGYIRYLEKN